MTRYTHSYDRIPPGVVVIALALACWGVVGLLVLAITGPLHPIAATAVAIAAGLLMARHA